MSLSRAAAVGEILPLSVFRATAAAAVVAF
jgi:hypothetical protein